MRTRPAHIEPSCPYCNNDHDPDIECRYRPESARFHLNQRVIKIREVQRIHDAQGKLIAVKQIIREE